MSIETDADLAALFDPETFGTPGRIIPRDPGSGSGVPAPAEAVAGIFTAGYAATADGRIASTEPVLVVPAARLTRSPERGDRVEIDGEGEFRLADPQPDGSGLIRLILERR